jgi:hypothetical protein
LSCYFQDFSGFLPFTYSFTDLGLFYNQYQRLMQHWKKVINLPLMEVSYEDIVEDPEQMSRSIVEFCGLTWDNRCLNFHQSKRVVHTASYDQVRQPIYKQSVARWKHYEAHLGPLLKALGHE